MNEIDTFCIVWNFVEELNDKSKEIENSSMSLQFTIEVQCDGNILIKFLNECLWNLEEDGLDCFRNVVMENLEDFLFNINLFKNKFFRDDD